MGGQRQYYSRRALTLDLWLISIPIYVDLDATITLQGPPLSGVVHMDFFVFSFNIKFGSQSLPENKKLYINEFYALVLQTTPEKYTSTIESTNKVEKPAPLLLNCISGLISPSTNNKEEKLPEPNNK
ncbi:unnamed protein product [Clonostachys rhizophaga]|uniref:DUF6603 domain-containing protein n=1 Tax=Clonostachys rhizophaga TaxID=160324 RepID=A0A9N9YJK7_9HYPO|nr:unnamed protein product [Clonostachys rhizophaga]